ncbi:hypothetical protein H0H87_004583 [Tephrocybe sp. NHM501043]|nr:hypothetical protein H0H87_004583 [Tephrocybe sp. NHM501043]
MRPSCRVLIPALTILSWSIESTYASFRPPERGIRNLRRQVRAADYSTSRPSYDNGNNTASSQSDSPSGYRPSPNAPQPSPKTRRSFPVGTNMRIERRGPGGDSAYLKVYDGDHSSSVADEDRDVPRKPRHPDDQSKKRSFSVMQALATRDIHLPTPSGGEKKGRSKNTGHKHKRSTSSVSRRHKSSTHSGRKNLELHSLKEKKDVIRRSVPVELTMLHIARGLKVSDVPSTSSISDAGKTAPVPATPSSHQGIPPLPASAPATPPVPGKDNAQVPKHAEVAFNTPDKDSISTDKVSTDRKLVETGKHT